MKIVLSNVKTAEFMRIVKSGLSVDKKEQRLSLFIDSKGNTELIFSDEQDVFFRKYDFENGTFFDVDTAQLGAGVLFTKAQMAPWVELISAMYDGVDIILETEKDTDSEVPVFVQKIVLYREKNGVRLHEMTCDLIKDNSKSSVTFEESSSEALFAETDNVIELNIDAVKDLVLGAKLNLKTDDIENIYTIETVFDESRDVADGQYIVVFKDEVSTTAVANVMHDFSPVTIHKDIFKGIDVVDYDMFIKSNSSRVVLVAKGDKLSCDLTISLQAATDISSSENISEVEDSFDFDSMLS